MCVRERKRERDSLVLVGRVGGWVGCRCSAALQAETHTNRQIRARSSPVAPAPTAHAHRAAPQTRLSPRWLLECCKQRLVPLMERLQRERDAYTQVRASMYDMACLLAGWLACLLAWLLALQCSCCSCCCSIAVNRCLRGVWSANLNPPQLPITSPKQQPNHQTRPNRTPPRSCGSRWAPLWRRPASRSALSWQQRPAPRRRRRGRSRPGRRRAAPFSCSSCRCALGGPGGLRLVWLCGS